MPQVFSYPQTYSEFWLNNYALTVWFAGIVGYAVAWALFLRYGNFNYGVDLGCFLKTGVIMGATMLSFGLPNAYRVRFEAENAHQGDTITLTDSLLTYRTRTGDEKQLFVSRIERIYQEDITFNPPTIFYIVSQRALPAGDTSTAARRDSIAVRENLPEFPALIKALTEKTGVKLERHQ